MSTTKFTTSVYENGQYIEQRMIEFMYTFGPIRSQVILHHKIIIIDIGTSSLHSRLTIFGAGLVHWFVHQHSTNM